LNVYGILLSFLKSVAYDLTNNSVDKTNLFHFSKQQSTIPASNIIKD